MTFLKQSNRQLVILLNLVLFSTPIVAKIFVHDLHYQKATDLIPAIQQQLDKNARLSGKEYQLIVNASQSDNIKVLNILKDLDQPRKTYRVEIKLLDHPLEAPLKENRNPQIDQPNQAKASKPLAKIESSSKQYQINASNRNAFYSQAKALDNIPLKVTRTIDYPQSSVVFFNGFYIPTSKRANLHKGFEILIHQSKGNQLLVKISATSQNIRGYQKQMRDQLSASTQLLLEQGQWVLFAATDREDYEPNIVPQMKDTTPATQVLQKVKIYSTGKKRSHAKWFYLRITQLD